MTEVVLEQKPQTTALAPFGKRNTNRERIEREEEELKQLTEKNAEKPAPSEESAEDDSNLSAEEKSFKKRYGDLRRHSQQQQLTLQKQIDGLVIVSGIPLYTLAAMLESAVFNGVRIADSMLIDTSFRHQETAQVNHVG